MKKKFDFDNKSKKSVIIDCLDCENYYTGACDGGAGGCDAYTPTRKITMEKDIRLIKGLTLSTWIIVMGYALALIFAVLAS